MEMYACSPKLLWRWRQEDCLSQEFKASLGNTVNPCLKKKKKKRGKKKSRVGEIDSS
jgi:hypothetical protein